MPKTAHGYRDLHDHLDRLAEAGALQIVEAPVDKDRELHPLVRWQFVGGLKEDERKAFLFTNVVDGKGRGFDMPVVVGALAASPRIYAIGMDAGIAEIPAKWEHAIANPIPPRPVNNAPCQEIVVEGEALAREGEGLDALPIPVSTPGFDGAPTLTATNTITADPDSGVQNMGTYRAGLKAPDRLVVRMATRTGGAGGYQHWKKYKARGEKMPCAIVLGCPPFVAFLGPQKLPLDVDEMGVAGGLAGEPINVVRARTVDLMVPAESEIVIEGIIDPEILEPEGPFGESHGHVALEEFNMPMQVTAITRRRDAIVPSYISQVAPSESSVMKKVAYEPLFLAHLRDVLGIRGVKRVSLHEPLTGLLKVTILTVERGMAKSEVWRALNGVAFFKADTGKICIAVDDDIDPSNADALLWAMAYRQDPGEDVVVVRHRSPGHGPKREHGSNEDSTLLIDATMKGGMPPLALPAREYMEGARKLWERLGLPELRPQPPWFGYDLGDWSAKWDEAAARAAAGEYLETGRRTRQRQRKSDFAPETSVRDVEDGWDDGGR